MKKKDKGSKSRIRAESSISKILKIYKFSKEEKNESQAG